MNHWTIDKLKVKSDRRGMPEPTVAQQKIDGWHLSCFTQVDGSIAWYGRKREPHLEMSKFVAGRPWALKALDLRLPPETAIVGEVHVPGRPASDVPTALRDPGSRLEWAAHAVPFKAGVWRGDEPVLWTCSLLKSWELSTPVTMPWSPLTDYAEHSRVRRWEGVVLKTSDYEGWSKIKLELVADLVCTGLVPGRPGKFFNEVASLMGSAYDEGHRLQQVACCSGMNDETRRAVTSRDIGRVFECRYQLVGAGGRLRHPRFIRWRDDKPAAECEVPA